MNLSLESKSTHPSLYSFYSRLNLIMSVFKKAFISCLLSLFFLNSSPVLARSSLPHKTSIFTSFVCAQSPSLDQLQQILNQQRKAQVKTPRFKGYRSARKALFSQMGPTLETIYTGKHYHLSKKKKRQRAPQGVNCEHLFPRAWMGKRKTKRFRLMEADLHNLYPSEIKVNSRRGHLPFGEVVNLKYQSAFPSKIGLNQQGREVIEPRDERKGDLARSLLYFALKWERPLRPDQVKILLKWAKNDPVDRIEQKRNQRILDLQGTSNPFVECPQWIRVLKH